MHSAPHTPVNQNDAGTENALPASLVDKDVSSGLVAVEGVSGLINDLFFENKAHKDAVAVFRTTLEREREMSSRLLEESHMTLDAWRSQFVSVQEENMRLRQLGLHALKQLQATQNRAEEAEALLQEVSTSLGPRTLAAVETFRRAKLRLRRMSDRLRSLALASPIHFFLPSQDQQTHNASRVPDNDSGRQVRAAAE